MNVIEKAMFVSAWLALAGAGSLLAASQPWHNTVGVSKSAAGDVPGIRASAQDQVPRTTVVDLRGADAILNDLRKRASAGDVDAALRLFGTLSLAERRAESVEVLRIPAIKDDSRVQDVLQNALSNDRLIWVIERCGAVDEAALRELSELWTVLAAKGHSLAKDKLARLANVWDRSAPREVLKTLYDRQMPAECDKAKPDN